MDNKAITITFPLVISASFYLIELLHNHYSQNSYKYKGLTRGWRKTSTRATMN